MVSAEAGMHLVALLPPGVGDKDISEDAARNGISAMPLSICCLTPLARGGLILGYAGPTARQINDGVRKLKAIVSRYHQS